jgi:hypothetical protein
MTLKYYGFSVHGLTLAFALLGGCGGTTTAGDGAGRDAGRTQETGAGSEASVGNDSAPKPDAAKPEASTDSGHGAPSTTYPAFPPFMPQVLDNGGPVITNPDFVTVTWSSLDSSYATWEAFDDALGASDYWSTTTAEYGIGPGTGGTHVELTTSPSFASMTDIENFVGQYAGSTWPPSTLTANTLYVIYLPPGVSIEVEGIGDACSNGIEGYHDQTTATDGTTVVFAVVFQCGGERPEDITTSTTHEAVEASTDPLGNGTYYGFDDAKFLAWDVFQQQNDELADMCEFYFDAEYVDSMLGQGVQRIWSNKSAAAGHAPCVPLETGPYYNVTPLMQENISINISAFGGPMNYPGLGYYIPVGSTKTFPVGFYSDSAAPPWQIAVYGGNPLTGQTANVDASVDVASGQNGTISNITVKVNGQDSTGTDSNLISVESKVAGDEEIPFGGGVTVGVHSRWMAILISSQK